MLVNTRGYISMGKNLMLPFR